MSGHHISSAKLLWTVAGSLLVLTILTVAAAYLHFPSPWNIVVAIGIAAVKATIVAAFFMNLYWDVKFNTMLILFSLLFFIIMISLTLMDTLFRVDPVPSFAF